MYFASPRSAPTCRQFLNESFFLLSRKTPHFIVALNPTLARVGAHIAFALERNSLIPCSRHNSSHTTRHEFVPAA